MYRSVATGSGNQLCNRLDLHSERVFSYGIQGADELFLIWIQNQRDCHRLERVIQTLSNGLSAVEWSQGVSTRTEQLRQEYITLLKSSRSLGQNIKDFLQQASHLQSIKETQKGLQPADSVKRRAHFDTFWTKNVRLMSLHRLTLVAFVFTPLNFATSFFGHIGSFFVTAVLVGGLGIVLSTAVKPVERALLRARERVARDNYMDLECVQRRDIPRFSALGERIINGLTVTDDDGEAMFHDVYTFRAVFMSWFRFHVCNI